MFYRLRYDLVANAVVLQVQRQIDFGAALNGTGTPNQTGVAAALNGSAGAASDSYAATLNAIAGAGNRAATLDSLSGEAIADVTTAALFAGEKFDELLQSRMALAGHGDAAARGAYALRSGMTGDLHANGLAGSLAQEANATANTADEAGAGFWLQGYGAQRRLDGYGGTASTRSFAGGVAAGLDAKVGPITLGAGGGFTQLDTTVDARGSTVQGRLYQGGAYAGYDTGAFYAGLTGEYYGGDIAVTRLLTIGSARYGAATGRPNVHGFNVGGVAGFRADIGGGTQIGVEGTATEAQATRRQYTEFAPGGLGLTAARDQRNLFTGTAELKLSHATQMNGTTVTPYASVGARVYSGDLQAIDGMQISGAPTGAGGFIVQGVKLSPVMGIATGGLELKTSNRFRVDLSAGGALANRTREGAVKLTTRIGF